MTASRIVPLIVVVAVALFLASVSIFTVDPKELALVLQFGKPVRDLISEPGPHLKWPFIETVTYIDKRILDLDNERQEVIVAENQRLEVDAFVRYRISDPLDFYRTVGDVRGANARLSVVLNSALRNTLADASIVDIVRNRREELMGEIRDQVRGAAKPFGIDVVDVRIKRADLPAENSEAVFKRMQAERQQSAALYRAQGAQRSQKIRADADATVTVTLADAQAQGEKIRGEGDAERNRIFAEVYGKDADFFRFYRSMQAYDASLKGDTRALLSPKSEFFRYFSDPSGGAETPSVAAPAQ